MYIKSLESAFIAVNFTFLKGYFTRAGAESQEMPCPSEETRRGAGEMHHVDHGREKQISITTYRGRNKAPPAHQSEGWHCDHLSRYHRPTAVPKDTQDT